MFAVAPFFDIDIAESVAAAAALLTFGVAIFALAYAGRQLSAARDTTRIDLTFRLYEHQLNPEFARHIALAADFITIDEASKQERDRVAVKRWKEWGEMKRSDQAQIVLYLNHLEAVGGLYEQGRLDKEAAMRFFGQAATAYWRRAEWFIARARGAGNPAIFDKWEALAAAYENRKKAPTRA